MKKTILFLLAAMLVFVVVGCGKDEKKDVAPVDELSQKVSDVMAADKGNITEQSTSVHPTYGTEKETFAMNFTREGKNIWFTMNSTSTDSKGKTRSTDYENKSEGYFVKESGDKEFTRLSDPTTESFDGIKEILNYPITQKADMNITKKDDNTFTAVEKDEKNKGKYNFTYTFTGSSMKVVVEQISADGKTKLNCQYEVK